jgi:pilus assembly protein CpaC
MRQLVLGYCGAVLAACVIAGSPANAQTASTDSPGLVELMDVDSAPQQVELVIGKARILRLGTDVRDILVADPEIADVVIRTPRLVYVLGRRVGATNVFFFDETGAEILRLNANVDLNLAGLRAALKKYLPDEDIQASSVTQNIILAGSVRSARAAEDARMLASRFVEEDANVILMLDIDADQQVVLRVRVAEMQRTAIKQLGLNLGFIFGKGTLRQNFALSTLPPTGIGNLALANTLDPTSLIGTALFTGGFNKLGLVFDALESNGLVKTLAEPNLTALSGETANFQAGGEFPITVVEDDGVTVEFKPFGIIVDFTPVVLGPDRISLRVKTEVSAIDAAISAGGFPGTSVRRTSTTVELPSGGSIIIAGLLQDDITETIEGVPGFKDLPILGALFRSVNFRRNETELVIAVTVHIVRPIDEQDIVLPTDGFAPASDIDLYLFGRLHATYARSATMPSLGELKAPTGYIME